MSQSDCAVQRERLTGALERKPELEKLAGEAESCIGGDFNRIGSGRPKAVLVEQLVGELLPDAAPALKKPIRNRDRSIKLKSALAAVEPDDGSRSGEAAAAQTNVSPWLRPLR